MSKLAPSVPLTCICLDGQNVTEDAWPEMPSVTNCYLVPSCRSVAGGNSMHPAGTIPNPAVLESFRPFLQQLAAGIVAGFTTTKAQSSATGGATAAGQAASKLPSTSTAAGTAPKEGLPPLPHIPQPMMQQVMLMMAKAGSCGIIQPGSSQPQLPRAPDAVAVVCRRGTKQPSSKKELGVAAIGIQGGKGAVQSSAVAGQAMGTGSVPFYQKQMQHSSSSSSLQTQQAPPRPQISAVALDLRCIQPQQHNRNCVIHASETEYAAAATGSAALGLPNDTTPAAPPPTPASVPAVSPMTVPSAAGAQKINSIRQHIMLLETSLGNMSPQVRPGGDTVEHCECNTTLLPCNCRVTACNCYHVHAICACCL